MKIERVKTNGEKTMNTKYTRRDAIAVGALALVGTTLTKFTTQAAQTPRGVKPPAGDPKSIKTRKASCNCGQLTVTCVGPDPDRISMCQCPLCQKGTGTAFSLQATFPKEEVTIEGKSTPWKFPIEGAPPVTFRNCARTGVTTHFCPACGSTVYYVLAETPENIGVRVGAFADPTFPPPLISGFEAYGAPWVENISALPMPGGHHQ
jgi:hypothetical protein